MSEVMRVQTAEEARLAERLAAELGEYTDLLGQAEASGGKGEPGV